MNCYSIKLEIHETWLQYNGGCQLTFAGNSALLPSDVIDFAMFPAQRFWQETVLLLDVI